MPSSPNLGDAARTIRYALTDPYALVSKLRLTQKAKRQPRGVIICCPAHPDRNPSCSVSLGPDGTIRVRCFSCGWTADAIGLVAKAHRLSTRGRDFPAALAIAADAAGLLQLASELSNGKPTTKLPDVPKPRVLAPTAYPDPKLIRHVWAQAGPIAQDPSVFSYLQRILKRDPSNLPARALPTTAELPRWAAYAGRSWLSTGHRLLVPTFDSNGVWRSLRARRVDGDQNTPKCLPPAGHRAEGLALANKPAVLMLRGRLAPDRIVISEGETDWLTWASRNEYPVLSLLSGTWNQNFADRIPDGCTVVIRTDPDEAGERYRQLVGRSLSQRCNTLKVP